MRVLFCSCVIITNKSKVLITQRPSGKFMEGFWEFPGGKVEQGEDSREAISRELREEISIDVVDMEHFMDVFYDYEDLKVYLEVFIITNYHGRALASGGQRQTWISLDKAIGSESEFSFSKLEAIRDLSLNQLEMFEPPNVEEGYFLNIYIHHENDIFPEWWGNGVGTNSYGLPYICLLYTSPSPRDATLSRMPSSA